MAGEMVFRQAGIASETRTRKGEGDTRHRRQLHQKVEEVSQENTLLKANVWHALQRDTIDADGLIDALKTKPILRFLFEDPQGGGAWEGRTLEQHTKMVLGQSSKYIRRDEWTNTLVTFEEFNLMLALHDIGKPVSVEFTGRTHEQDVYTPSLFQGTLGLLDIAPAKMQIMKSLVTDDSLGDFVKREKQVSLEEIADKIKTASASLDIDPKEYALLRRIYQLCDSSSYTLDATNGEYSHDDAFTFGKTNSKDQPILEYAPDLEEKWQKLIALL